MSPNSPRDGKPEIAHRRQDPSHPAQGDEAADENRAGTLPEFTDPAHSSRPAGSPVQPDAPKYDAPPKDTEYAGHPEFSQDAAANKPPRQIGNSEPVDDVDEQTRHSDGVTPPDND